LNVSAKDLGTGKEQKITITASSGLSKDEVERMRKDAEAHADEDKQRREEVEIRNQADNQVYRAEKLLRENADKISGDDKSNIEGAVAAVKESLKGSDTAAIKSALEKLNEAWQKFSEILYKAAQEKAQSAKAGGGPTNSASSGGGDSADKDQGPIIDAEVVDEKKK
jgi:molecular chaperone DnaK